MAAQRITITRERWSSLEQKMDQFDLEQRFSYSVQRMLQDLDLALKVPEISLGQELALINTNIIIANRGAKKPDIRSEWRTIEGQEYLVLYYALEQALESMTVNSIKDLLANNGIDYSQHENKSDYINLYIGYQIDIRESLGFW